VLEHRPADCEIIVAESFGYADPYGLAVDGEVRLLPLARRTCPIAMLNQAVAQSRGEVLHILEAGTVVEAGWTDGALDRFDEHPALAAVAPLVIDESRQDRVLAAGLQLSGAGEPVWRGARTKLSARWDRPTNLLGCVLPAGFYRRSALPKPSPFDRRFGVAAADAALAARLVRSGWQATFEPSSRVTMTPRSRLSWGEALVAARSRERFFWHIWRQQPRVSRLLLHPVSILKAIVTRGRPVATLLGRLWGSIDALLPIPAAKNDPPAPHDPQDRGEGPVHRGPISLRASAAQRQAVLREQAISRAA
jgi:hypothetical protein